MSEPFVFDQKYKTTREIKLLNEIMMQLGHFVKEKIDIFIDSISRHMNTNEEALS